MSIFMVRRFPLALFLCALVDVSTARAQAHFPSRDSLMALARPLVESGRTKGLVIGVLEADGSRQIVSFGSAGPLTNPLGRKSVFEIGSVGKVFTTSLLADMLAKGEVKLSDPVARYLPKRVRVPGRNGKEITLLDLATHYSSLPDVPPYRPINLANPYAEYTLDRVYAFLDSYALPRDIGTKFEYSNLGMGLLGHALASRAGGTYEDVLKKRVLAPLGMTMTAVQIRPESEMAEWITRGYRGESVTALWDLGEGFAGAGALKSNADDMLSFLAANVGPAKSTLEVAMRTTHIKRNAINEKQSIGLGWMMQYREERQIVWHSGDTGGYQAFIGFDPAKSVAVVILSNSQGRDAQLLQLGFDLVAPRASR